MTPLVAFAASVLVWALVAGRLAHWGVMPPLAMVVAGVICSGFVPDLVQADGSSPFKRTVEITLAIVLFVDATEVSHGWLRRTAGIPIRLLAIALPLSVVLAWAFARLLFSGNLAWLLITVATLVMISDSAICGAVISDERLPETLGNSLKVESGFNDGLASPFVLLFLAAAVAESDHAGVGHAFGHAAKEILIGTAVGVVLGLLTGIAFRWVRKHHWSTHIAERLGLLVLALLAYGVSVELHGGGFVAAFVTALVANAVPPGLPKHALRFTHDAGQLLSAAVWFTFGVLARQTLANGVSWSVIGYAILVLTVARIAAVFVSMIGESLTWRQVAFLGWLGPRGLGTVIFGLIAIGQLPGVDQQEFVAKVVTVTVGLSLVAHGLTSRWLVSWMRPAERDGKPSPSADTAMNDPAK